MSAADHMRSMLDQLMGTARNSEAGSFKIKFNESKVCKSFLLGCCPNDLLANTRMDMGECLKIHDLALRADYEIASKTKDYFYDLEALEHLEIFLSDCDIKMEQSKRRLKETQEELSEDATSKLNSIHDFSEQIGTRLAKAEELGAQGNVESSLKLMEEVEDLKRKKLSAELEYRNTTPASSFQQQKLRVCEVCSAFLGIHDNDRRLADHFGGRLHVGFIILRNKLAELKENSVERRILREKDRENNKNRGSPDLREKDSRRHSNVKDRDRSISRERRRRNRSQEQTHRKSSERRKSHKRSRSRDNSHRYSSSSKHKKHKKNRALESDEAKTRYEDY